MFAEIKYFDYLEQIFQNVRRIGEETWPIRIEGEVESVRM
jgi:hypothetical protein